MLLCCSRTHSKVTFISCLQAADDKSELAEAFVVHRYRLDGQQWNKKGSTDVPLTAPDKGGSLVVEHLQNGLRYR
jgi:hypothetical protein